MNVTYEHKSAMTFIGYSTSIRPEEVYSSGDMQSPDYECGIWVPICKIVGQNEQETAETISTMLVTGIL